MICENGICTGCGACFAICPKHCITMATDQLGKFTPKIKQSLCIACNLCKKVCPQNNNVPFYRPNGVFVCYSTNSEIYANAASGGVATSLYLTALHNHWFVMGTKFTKNGVVFEVLASEQDIAWACNSKYVFSNMLTNDVFLLYYEALKGGKPCLFIGLPCQVASLISFVKTKNNRLLARLYCIDIICHGTPPWKYLREHLDSIEKISRKKGSVDTIKFRSKKKGYYFECLAENRIVYGRAMFANDAYGHGFLSNLIFNENCYACIYATEERVGDITIGDFDGLGERYAYQGKRGVVSVVMVHSEKGKILLQLLENIELLYMEQRPLDEPYLSPVNAQLHHPSIPHKKRAVFLTEYETCANFQRAVKKALGLEFYSYYIGMQQNRQRLKNLLTKVLKKISPRFFYFLKTLKQK